MSLERRAHVTRHDAPGSEAPQSPQSPQSPSQQWWFPKLVVERPWTVLVRDSTSVVQFEWHFTIYDFCTLLDREIISAGMPMARTSAAL